MTVSSFTSDVGVVPPGNIGFVPAKIFQLVCVTMYMHNSNLSLVVCTIHLVYIVKIQGTQFKSQFSGLYNSCSTSIRLSSSRYRVQILV